MIYRKGRRTFPAAFSAVYTSGGFSANLKQPSCRSQAENGAQRAEIPAEKALDKQRTYDDKKQKQTADRKKHLKIQCRKQSEGRPGAEGGIYLRSGKSDAEQDQNKYGVLYLVQDFFHCFGNPQLPDVKSG